MTLHENLFVTHTVLFGNHLWGHCETLAAAIKGDAMSMTFSQVSTSADETVSYDLETGKHLNLKRGRRLNISSSRKHARMPHCLRRRSLLRQARSAYLLGILALAMVVGVCPAGTAVSADEGLIIAVDVSRSMQKKLPAVKRAIYALVG
jgi:hypothetical protein